MTLQAFPAHVIPFAGVPDLFGQVARRRPQHPAVVFEDAVTTWGELAREVDALAVHLRERAGVRPGDRVLLYAQNGPRFITAFHAIAQAGAIAVLASPLHLTAEVRHVVDDSGARVALAGGELLDRLEPLVASGLAQRVSLGNGVDGPAAAEPQDARIASWETATRHGLRSPAPAIALDDPCVIAYTSGTTGRPKGCVLSHRALIATGMTMARWRANHADTVILGTSPLFHLMGLSGSVMVPATLGCTLVLMGRWDAARAAENIQRHRVTNWGVMPTILVDLMAHAERHDVDLGSLELLSGGGGRMPQAGLDRLRERHGVAFMACYGMTEAVLVLANPRDDLRPACLGVPTYGVDARIVDPENLAELPDGETGEIVVAGDQVMTAYWNDPAATAAAFLVRDGRRYLRTGDLGRRTADGRFHMVDRLKRMISVSGFKVWPAEIEDRLQAHPSVVQACVVSVPDPRRGEEVRAFVVPSGDVDASTLIGWLRERVASYKCPRRIDFVTGLPRSAAGKVDWRRLQDEARAGQH